MTFWGADTPNSQIRTGKQTHVSSKAKELGELPKKKKRKRKRKWKRKGKEKREEKNGGNVKISIKRCL